MEKTVGLPGLRAVRKRRKMTQAEVGALIGRSAATITRYESGERDPRVSEVLELAEKLRVRPSILLHEPENGRGSAA